MNVIKKMITKIVSFDVAKAIKEAKYAQTSKPIKSYSINGVLEPSGSNYRRGERYDAPTYLEVWLWLWREKNIRIEIINSKVTTQCYASINDEKDTILFDSPEDAIVAAINYLVDNDLIK